MFKIRNKITGLFSTGGTIPQWNENGKVWRLRGHIVSHINQLWKDQFEDYCAAEVVKYKLEECMTEDISAFVIAAKRRKVQREERHRINYSKRIEIESLESEIRFAKSFLKEKEEKLKTLTS
jgi:hypothetical protein